MIMFTWVTEFIFCPRFSVFITSFLVHFPLRYTYSKKISPLIYVFFKMQTESCLLITDG